MDQFIEGKNPYVILELENGQKSSFEEIKKVRRAPGQPAAWGSTPAAAVCDHAVTCFLCLQAYRRLALVKHPDKAKNTNAGGYPEAVAACCCCSWS
jgi:hypothetical protein